MKKTYLTALFCLAVWAVSAGLPEVKLIHSGVICDTVEDALSPGGMAIAPNGDYLLTFQNKGDNGPGAFSYIVRSSDNGRTWSKPEVFAKPAHSKQGISAMICNIPGSRELMVIVTRTDYDSESPNPFDWNSRVGHVELYTTDADAKKFKLVAKLKSAPKSLPAAMGYLTRLANGDLVLPAYTYFYGMDKIEGETYGSGWWRSTDNGKTWGDFELVFKDRPDGFYWKEMFNESAFAVRDDGIVVGYCRTDKVAPGHQFMTLSSDHGKTWSRPIRSGRQSMDIPLMVKLDDHKGFLMIGGWREQPLNVVSILYSPDGIAWDLIGKAFYQPDNGHNPMNSATGGCQSLVKGPGKHQYFIAFYAHDPKLPGLHKTRIEGNMIELVFDK